MGAGDAAQRDFHAPQARRAAAGLRQVDRGRARRARVDRRFAKGASQRHAGDESLVLGRRPVLLGGEAARVDLVDRKVAVRALESDQIRAADFAHREVVGVGLGRRTGLLVEQRVDIDGRAVRIEYRAERLEDIGGRGVVGNVRACLKFELATRVLDAEPEREHAAGDIRVDGHGLQVVDAGIDRRTVAQGRGDHIDRRVRASHQACCLCGFHPADLLLVDARLVAHEGDGVGDVGTGALLGDGDVVETVERGQARTQLRGRQGNVDLDIGAAFGASDFARLAGVAGVDDHFEAGVECAALAVDDNHARAAGGHRRVDHRRVACRAGIVRVELSGQIGCEVGKGYATHIAAELDFVEQVADTQSPGLARLRRTDQGDEGRRGTAAIDGAFGHRHQADRSGKAASCDVGDKQRILRGRCGDEAGQRCSCKRRGSIDLDRERRGNVMPARSGGKVDLERRRQATHVHLQGPLGSDDRCGADVRHARYAHLHPAGRFAGDVYRRRVDRIADDLERRLVGARAERHVGTETRGQAHKHPLDALAGRGHHAAGVVGAADAHRDHPGLACQRCRERRGEAHLDQVADAHVNRRHALVARGVDAAQNLDGAGRPQFRRHRTAYLERDAAAALDDDLVADRKRGKARVHVLVDRRGQRRGDLRQGLRRAGGGRHDRRGVVALDGTIFKRDAVGLADHRQTRRIRRHCQGRQSHSASLYRRDAGRGIGRARHQ